MLTPFAEEIWTAGGPECEVFGFRYPTRMAVIRLTNGDLVVWSPVALNGTLGAAVDALGPVRHLIAPNAFHHLHIGDWKRAYPDARFYAPPGLRRKRRDLVFDADLGDAPEPAWAGQIDQVAVRGNLLVTEIVFFHAASGTVLFTDLLQQFPDDWFTGWRATIARMDRMVGTEPAVPRKFRVSFFNRRAARAALERILEWPARRVVMAHGVPVTEDAGPFLRRAFKWLTG